MRIFWSASTRYFYDSRVNTTIPDDVVEIDNSLREQLIQGELEGKVIGSDPSGRPVLQNPPPLNAEAIAAVEREWRDTELQRISWLRDRHRDQQDAGLPLTLDTAQFSELLVYMQALRDWPQTPAFPQAEFRPVAPPWIAEQTQ
ncbi:hypothetical protein BK655_23885 [Pseudomonas brassicacearum]|uniref:phage tail assembly chaperone n=1 Tax=Pseudomonas brassicacearum TaxID=930166 RepID=UPI000F47A752|nr:phage tail assembly chaperone [Pseudomonas brassicacearum]ROM75320.1 hypothetical protein BK655_23885 [Pseudomonas brassicacearum]